MLAHATTYDRGTPVAESRSAANGADTAPADRPRQLAWNLPAEEPSNLSWPPAAEQMSFPRAMDSHLAPQVNALPAHALSLLPKDERPIYEQLSRPPVVPTTVPELDHAEVEAALGEILGGVPFVASAQSAPDASIARGPPPADQSAAGGPSSALSATPAEHPHSVFDRMGKSMSFANTFDLGRIDVDRQFSEIESGLDLAAIARIEHTNALGLPAPAKRLRSPANLHDDELAADLSAMKARPISALSPASDSIEPLPTANWQAAAPPAQAPAPTVQPSTLVTDQPGEAEPQPPAPAINFPRLSADPAAADPEQVPQWEETSDG